MKYLKYFITEKMLFSLIKDQNEFNFYLNPKTTKRFDKNSRGFITIEGDIFLIDDGWHYIHKELFQSFRQNGYLIFPGLYDLWKNIDKTLDYLVPIQKVDNTDKLYLSESFTDIEIEKNYNKIINIFKKAKEKNPQYTFIIFPSNLDPSDNEYFHEYKKLYLEI